MPTAILDVEASDLPPLLNLDPRYTHAFVLFRWKGAPVGHVVLPVREGSLTRTQLADSALRHAGQGIVHEQLNRYVGWSDDARSARAPATIAVCTRDRIEDLGRCLAALDRLPDDGQEILVVDSASRDAESIRALVARYPRARYLRLDRPGLDLARNAALRAALHPIVAFTDDDATPDPNWLRALLRNFESARTLCVTGLTLPAELESEAQEVFERTNGFARGYTRVVHDGTKVDPFLASRVGAGVNMALRRSILQAIGPFDDALDAGTPTRSGGDHDMFTRILAAGYVIVYEPAALSWHTHRRSWSELRAAVSGYGTGVFAYLTAHALRGELGAASLAVRWLIWQLVDLLRGRRLPRELGLAQLAGCMWGPFAYLQARRALARARPVQPAAAQS